MTKRILAAIVAFVMILGCMPVFHAHATEIAPNVSGTTYYVSSLHGAEGNNGTSQSAPFASLLEINKITLQPGDRVLLERGSVFVDEYLHIRGSGSADAPIIIDVYGDESQPKPLIQTNATEGSIWYQDYGKRLDNTWHKYQGDVSSCILLYDVEYIEISNIAMTNEGNFKAGEVYNTYGRMDRTGVAGIAENIGTVDHVYLRNLDIRNVQGSVHDKHMANGGIYLLCHNPDNEAATGIARFDDVLIEGCRLDEVNRWGIAVGYTAYWDAFPYGPSIDPEICKTYGSTNVVIRNNYLTNVGGDGITTMYCYMPIMEYNVLDGYCQDMTMEIYGNNNQRVAAGIWPWMCKTPILQYNEAYNSTYCPDAQAWDADWGDNAIYQYNYSCNNAGGAVMFCGQHACNTVFRYNISQYDLAGVLNLAGSPNGEIYNNVFYIKEGVKINRDGMSGGWGNTISNNIFYYTGSEPASAVYGNWGDIEAEWNNNVYYNYANIPNDKHAITADPMFVDPGKGPTGAQESGLVHDRSVFEGYKLQEGSPAIDAGMPIENSDIYPNSGLDFFGNEVDLIPDIGAYDAGTFEADAERAVIVDVELGETTTIVDTVNDFTGLTPVVENEKISSVVITDSTSVARTYGESVAALEDGQYILVNNRAGKTLTNANAASQQGEVATMAGLSLEGTKENIADNAVWNITASGNGYTIQDANGKYLLMKQNDAKMVDEESVVSVVYRNNNWTLNQDGAYLNDAAGKGICASGWNGDGMYDASTDSGSQWTIYTITEKTFYSTELTFTGLFPGTTNIFIGDTLYLVRVGGNVQKVEMEVGETATFTDDSGNYRDADTSTLDENVATVELSGMMTDDYSLGDKVTALKSGSKYILVNTRSSKPVTNLPTSGSGATGLLLNGAKEDAAKAAIWTITGEGSSYTVQDLSGQYMTVGSSTAGLSAASTTLTLNYNGSTWTIAGNGAYLNHFGGSGSTCAAGWQDASAAGDAGSQWEIYEVTAGEAENGTQITFTAVGGGETYVKIGQIVYHIVVKGDAHGFENGFCDHCSELEPAELVNGVYEIGNAGQLYWFRNHVAEGNLDADAIVIDNITVNEDVLVDGELNEDADLRKWNGIGSSANKYTGTFDGQGFTISGLTSRGLFAYVGVGGVVKNVTVADSYISGSGVGAIAHTNFGGTIDNCTVTGSVISGSQKHVGGIVGTNYSTVTRCTNDGCPVYNEEPSSVGGIVGYNNDSGSDPAAQNPVVSFCVNTGSVTTDYDSSERPVGGIVGENDGGLVSNCYNVGAVESTGDAVGGIVGYSNQGTIENCHNVGAVEGDTYVGGIVGRAIHPTTIRNCYYLADAETDDQDGTTAKSETVFASGEVAYLLNGSSSDESVVWKQTLGSDTYPKFQGAVVYYNSQTGAYSNGESCAHTSVETVVENEKAPTCTEDGSYENVVRCSACGEEISRETVNVPALGHVWNGTDCENCDATRTNPFVDVPADSFYFDPVLWAAENGITAGVNDKHFAPNDACTRAQVVTFLWRAANKPEPQTTENPFVDVKESDYFYKAVLWAVENGITAGTSNTTFAPNTACNRAQAVTFLWRYMGKPDASAEVTFTDVEAGQFYSTAVAWAVKNGITAGTSNTTFSPNEICNRAQVVTFLYRTFAK